MEGLRYTIVNEKTGGEAVLDIAPEGEQYTVSVFNTRLYIGKQQLFELGHLFIALAGEGDKESVDELLDGYGLSERAAMFYSVWDDGEVLESPAIVKDGEVTVLKSHNKDDDASLEREYVTFIDDNDEEEQEVCTQCHERLLVTVMVDDPTGDGQHEEQHCPECDLES